MTIRQSDIARELDVSEMQISRAVALLGITSRPLADFDAFKLIFAAELQNVGLQSHVVIDVMAEFSKEIRYVFAQQDRRCWIVMVDTDRISFRSAAMSEAHALALIDLFPLAAVLPIHTIADRARQRLTALKNRKAAA